MQLQGSFASLRMTAETSNGKCKGKCNSKCKGKCNSKCKGIGKCNDNGKPRRVPGLLVAGWLLG